MKNEAIVRKMIAYIQKVLGYCEEVIYEDFEKNTLLVEACVFN